MYTVTKLCIAFKTVAVIQPQPQKVNYLQIGYFREKYHFYLTHLGIDGRNMQAHNIYLSWSIIKKHLRHGYISYMDDVFVRTTQDSQSPLHDL